MSSRKSCHPQSNDACCRSLWSELAVVLWLVCSAASADEGATATQVDRFLNRYCLDCHSGDTVEGERDFSAFRLPLKSEPQMIAADEIVDQLTLKQMPPEDAEQPTETERLEVLEQLRNQLQQASEAQSHTSRTVMRRLSHREYQNTLETLFGRRVDTLGLTADFPKENLSEHLDNIGSSLVTSGFLLDQYFLAASRLVEMRLGKPLMEPRDWHFKDHFVQYEELSGSHKSVFNYEYLCLYEQPNTDTRQGGYGHIEDFLEGVPVSGLYDIEVHAQAMHRDTHYDPKIFRIDFSEPFQLAVVPGDVTKGHIHYPQAIEPILGQTIVPDDQPEWLKFRVWLEAGQTPRFIFPNGPYESRASVISVNQRYKDEFKNPKTGVSRSTLLREGSLPHIRIGEIKVRGPLVEAGGSIEEKAVFGEQGFQEERAIEQLEGFAQRAFRRPLNANDRKRIQTTFDRRVSEGATQRQAALDCLKLILCSPSFLYLAEITEDEDPRLNAFDLASRLSYALWSAPPDELLFASAASGELLNEEKLAGQIERLLDDQRSEEFVRGFLDGWLSLRDIGDQPPPRKREWEYYSTNLPASMKQEARLFFQHLLQEDRTVMDLLKADYTFVDKKLARLYDLPQKDTLRLADGFQKVSLPENSRRGGVLGMASVLTVSANGVETSPVTRGVWVLENILGSKVPPPPDEVPDIEANVSGAKSIREKLTLHSQDSTCFVCHKKIDPIGYALETFDPIGRLRTRYPKQKGQSEGARIDASGQLPSGESFDNFVQLRDILSDSRQEQFARALIRKLLSYSTGRHMTWADRFQIDAVREQSRESGFGLRSMVRAVLLSETFRSR